MKRALFGMGWIGALALVISSQAVSQPPEGKGGQKGGGIRFELGQLFPPPLADELKLTPEQQRELDAIRKDLKAKLDKLLTDEQKKAVENWRPTGKGEKGGGHGEKGEKGGKSGGQPLEPLPMPAEGIDATARFTVKGALKAKITGKSPFTIVGDAVEGLLGDPRLEYSGYGVRLLSGEDMNKDGIQAGGVTAIVQGVNQEKGRWYRIRVRGLAQEHFAVDRDELFIQVEYFKDDGKNPLDHVKKTIYPQVELERKGFADAGTNKNVGPATWRNYAIDVRTPFAEVDTFRVGVGFGSGMGKPTKSEFWVSEIEVAPIPDPADFAAPAKPSSDRNPPALKSLVKLGGRWYFDPRGGDREPPKQFDHTNADRLYYLSDRLETPFAGNMTSTLRRGYLDIDGKMVEKDQFVEDAVVISFTDKHLVMKSKNLPNHPTAVFPDRSRSIDGNPNYIQEQRNTWRIPLEPKVNSGHVAMTMQDKQALPMGPIGVAANGVIFFNPFDHIAEADAVWRLDRCCGHPSPTSQYHYHKYPVCVNTPWLDDGTAHSPLIGFAFDGFPVYGPYEAAGVLAKDSKDNPLNEFNLHMDDARGPHYHVTPGRFPHIIGGYWGEIDPSTMQKKGPKKK